MKKVIAIVLLLVGIGLSALGAYGYFFNEYPARFYSSRSEATAKLNGGRDT